MERPTSLAMRLSVSAGFRRESPDLSIRTDHHDGNIHARQKIRQIIGELSHLDVPGLQLIVDRRHFFVGGLQFFLGGLQFLIGALQFFVRGLKFLVG